MKINQIKMPYQAFDDGLKDIEMRNLGDLIILAGANGSGKTRFLRRLSELADALREPVVNVEREIKVQHVRIKEAKETGEDSSAHARRLIELERRLTKLKSLTFDTDGQPAILWLRLTPDLFDPRDRNSRDVEASLSTFPARDLSELRHAYAWIEKVQKRWWNATHQLGGFESDQKEQAITAYEKLCSMIKALLKADVSCDIDGNPTLYGRRLAEAGLSDGQKILLQVSAAIHAKAPNLGGLIVLMDEPETHLHPDVLLETIKGLRNVLENGQIWIATHSLPLVASFFDQSVFWMSQGKLMYGGNIPDQVVAGLIGDEEQRQRLHDLLALPLNLAVTSFSAQTLHPPIAIQTGPQDPQMNQVHQTLKAAPVAQLAVLDFGAGKARLLDYLAEKVQNFREQFDYAAYEPDEKNWDICARAVLRAYSQLDERLFQETGALKNQVKRFDWVIMCNVLHELPPTVILDLFGTTGVIAGVLKDGGKLLIIELSELERGERAHGCDFFLFLKDELERLFACSDEKPGIESHAATDARFQAFTVPRDFLTRVTPQTLQLAIESGVSTAKERLIRLRNEGHSFRVGRRKGFWTHQLTNGLLLLDELNDLKQTTA